MELDLIFERNLLKLGLVSVKDFIEYVSRIQKSVNIIGKEIAPEARVESFQFLIRERTEGSQVYKLIPQSQAPIFGESLVDKAVEKFSEINSLLTSDIDGSNYKEIKGFIKNSPRRNRLYNYLQFLSKKPGAFHVSLKKTRDAEPLKIFVPLRKYKKSIKKWKELEIIKRKEEFIGALTIIHGEGEIYFKIRDIYGSSIKHRLSESEVKNYAKYFKQIVKVEGLYNPVRNFLETIEKFELYNEIFLNELEDIKFNFPIKFEILFMENAFFIINKEMNLYGAGKTFKEMYNDLYLDIKSAINLYIKSEKELTSGALKIKSLIEKMIKIESLGD